MTEGSGEQTGEIKIEERPRERKRSLWETGTTNSFRRGRDAWPGSSESVTEDRR